MPKKILVISTSLRVNSNSDSLAEKFASGAEDSGHDVKRVSLKGKKIDFCIGCMACHKLGHCVKKDDVNAIVADMEDSDIIVFATPVYYYGMAGQMKTLLDRANALYTSNYKFREIYLIATAADDTKDAVDGTINGVICWLECFPKAQLKGVVYGVGVAEAGAVNKLPVLAEAYNMGRGIC